MSIKPLPNNALPFLDITGRVSLPWFYFLQSIVGPAEPISNITVSGSPFTYIASSNGNLSITGGTVSNIQIKRGQTTISTGLINGLIPVMQNDSVIITYTVLPTVNFIPGM